MPFHEALGELQQRVYAIEQHLGLVWPPGQAPAEPPAEEPPAEAMPPVDRPPVVTPQAARPATAQRK